jgi:hypothetical protein
MSYRPDYLRLTKFYRYIHRVFGFFCPFDHKTASVGGELNPPTPSISPFFKGGRGDFKTKGVSNFRNWLSNGQDTFPRPSMP